MFAGVINLHCYIIIIFVFDLAGKKYYAPDIGFIEMYNWKMQKVFIYFCFSTKNPIFSENTAQYVNIVGFQGYFYFQKRRLCIKKLNDQKQLKNNLLIL